MAQSGPRHIYFVLPEAGAPVGGINVAFQFAEILRDNGYSVSVHFESAEYRYDYYDSSIETTFSPFEAPAGGVLGVVPFHWPRLKRKLAGEPKVNRLSMPGPEDLVLIPEFAYRHQHARFPGVPHVILNQDYSGVLTGVFCAFAEGLDPPETLRGFFSTSRAAQEAADVFSDLPNWHVPLFIDAGHFPFHEVKKKQIVYLPRKRELEGKLLAQLLGASPELADWEIRPVENVPNKELRAIVGDALIFISMSCREGFGLPPAEAMATGSLVVGYRGVGGKEFLTEYFAFPVEEDETVALYKRILAVAEAFEADPDPLDDRRRRASEHILGTYSRQNSEKALLKAVRDVVM